VFTVKIAVTAPLAAGVTETGTRPQVTVAFTGAIAQVNPTAELKLFTDVTVMVDVVEKAVPTGVDEEAGEFPIVKSATVRTNVVVRF
jgi:hypothetical protein